MSEFISYQPDQETRELVAELKRLRKGLSRKDLTEVMQDITGNPYLDYEGAEYFYNAILEVTGGK